MPRKSSTRRTSTSSTPASTDKGMEGVPADVLPMSGLMREQLREPPCASCAGRPRCGAWNRSGLHIGLTLPSERNSFSAISRFVSRCAIRPTSAYSRSVSAANARGGPSALPPAPLPRPARAPVAVSRGLRSCGKQRLEIAVVLRKRHHDTVRRGVGKRLRQQRLGFPRALPSRS